MHASILNSGAATWEHTSPEPSFCLKKNLRTMWLFTEMLTCPDSSFQHAKLFIDFMVVASTNPATDKTVVCFKSLVGLEFLTSVWSLQQIQHNIWELNRRPQGDIVDPGFQTKLVMAGSKSNNSSFFSYLALAKASRDS